MKCCFCKKEVGEYGNNAQPIMEGRCCRNCNEGIVIPIRMLRAFHERKKGEGEISGIIFKFKSGDYEPTKKELGIQEMSK